MQNVGNITPAPSGLTAERASSLVVNIEKSTPPKAQNNKNVNSKTELDLVHGIIKKFLVPFTCWGSTIFGFTSFITGAILKNQNDLIDKTATYFSKAGVFATGAYGVIENATKKSFFATIGYLSDVIVSTFATGKNLYLLRGYGSALDQIPAILKDVAHHDKTQQKYNPTNDPNYKFTKCNGFLKSISKTFYAGKVIIQNTFKDVKREFVKTGLSGALREFFSMRRAERSLLASTFGLLGSSFAGTVLGYEKIGGSIRDLFGVYADYGVLSKKYSVNPKTGKPTGSGNMDYWKSSVMDLSASAIDFAARWLPIENLHFLALGINRFSARKLVEAIAKDHEDDG